MCGRFTLTKSFEEIASYLNETFEVTLPDMPYTPRYNIAPTQSILAVIHDGSHYRVGHLPWGIPFAGNESKTNACDIINARYESLLEKPMFTSLVKNKRCLFLMDGYYEWQRTGKESDPFYLSMPNHALFLVAGLYTSWSPLGQERRFGSALITTEANKTVKPIHPRMPAILPLADAKAWLNAPTSIAPYPDDLRVYAVSKNVNKASVDNPSLIEKTNRPSLL